MEGSPAPALLAAIETYWAAFDSGSAVDLAPVGEGLVQEHFARWAGLSEPFLSGMVFGPPAEELTPWAVRLQEYGEAGELAVELLGAQASGLPVDEPGLASLASQVAAFDGGPKPTGDVMLDFLKGALEALQAE